MFVLEVSCCGFETTCCHLTEATLPTIGNNASMGSPAVVLRASASLFYHFFKAPSSFDGDTPAAAGLPSGPKTPVTASTIVEMVIDLSLLRSFLIVCLILQPAFLDLSRYVIVFRPLLFVQSSGFLTFYSYLCSSQWRGFSSTFSIFLLSFLWIHQYPLLLRCYLPAKNYQILFASKNCKAILIV